MEKINSIRFKLYNVSNKVPSNYLHPKTCPCDRHIQDPEWTLDSVCMYKITWMRSGSQDGQTEWRMIEMSAVKWQRVPSGVRSLHAPLVCSDPSSLQRCSTSGDGLPAPEVTFTPPSHAFTPLALAAWSVCPRLLSEPLLIAHDRPEDAASQPSRSSSPPPEAQRTSSLSSSPSSIFTWSHQIVPSSKLSEARTVL